VPLKPAAVLVKVPIVAMVNLLWFISTAPIAASMEETPDELETAAPAGPKQSEGWQ
jgi:hypothetical protein